jgi:hypothetical protein
MTNGRFWLESPEERDLTNLYGTGYRPVAGSSETSGSIKIGELLD